MLKFISFTAIATLTKGFSPIQQLPARTSSPTALNLAPAKDVVVLPTENEVNQVVHKIVETAAKKAIEEKGTFTLAIPGGSVLKVLSSLDPSSNWVTKTTLAYVNHKCVPNDDLSSAIHAQACDKFLNKWGFPMENVITLDGTDDAKAEADAYQKKLENLPADVLLRDEDGFPVFDLCLVGVGDDGHVGSLYPDRDEINEVTRWTVGVEMKNPPSISLTLPIMQRAKQGVVSAAGKSPKYPNGKASAMRLAVDDEEITPSEFPACALRYSVKWIFDEPNASEMPSRHPTSLDSVLSTIE